MLHSFASGIISSIFSRASALLPSCYPSHFPFRISTSRPQVIPVYRLRFVLTSKFRGEVERKQARSNGGINENQIPDSGCPRILLAVSWTASVSRLQINYGAMFALRNFAKITLRFLRVHMQSCKRKIITNVLSLGN